MNAPLPREDQRQLSAALGYFELEMISEALEALDGISPASADTRNVLALRLLVLQKAENWLKAQTAAARLVTLEPTDPGWSIALAYATRRADCIERAQAILHDAMIAHPGRPLSTSTSPVMPASWRNSMRRGNSCGSPSSSMTD